MVPGILTAIHLQTDHPTPHQLKQVFSRSFAALDLDKQIKANTDSCHTCATLRRLPKQITEFSTTETPKHICPDLSTIIFRRPQSSQTAYPNRA